MLPSWRPLWGSLAAAVSPSPLSPSMHVPQESLSKFLSYKHPSVDSGPTGIPSDLILLTAAKPRFLHEVPFRGSGGRKFWGTVIPHPWPLLGASLPWSSPPPRPGRMGGLQSPSTVAQSHWCLWASQVPRTGQQPPHSLVGPRAPISLPPMGAHPSRDVLPVLPGPLALAPGSASFRQETAPLLPSDTPLHMGCGHRPRSFLQVGTTGGLLLGISWAFGGPNGAVMRMPSFGGGTGKRSMGPLPGW